MNHGEDRPLSPVPVPTPGPSGARQHSTDHELDCKERVKKRKAGVLDEGGVEECVVGTHRRPRRNKRGRGQSIRPQSRTRPPPKRSRRVATTGTRGPGNESDDPIDFLHDQR